MSAGTLVEAILDHLATTTDYVDANAIAEAVIAGGAHTSPEVRSALARLAAEGHVVRDKGGPRGSVWVYALPGRLGEASKAREPSKLVQMQAQLEKTGQEAADALEVRDAVVLRNRRLVDLLAECEALLPLGRVRDEVAKTVRVAKENS